MYLNYTRIKSNRSCQSLKGAGMWCFPSFALWQSDTCCSQMLTTLMSNLHSDFYHYYESFLFDAAFYCHRHNLRRGLTMYHISLLFTVSLSRVGHSDTWGQESDQSDVNDQPRQKDHCRPGTQASLGLRKCSSRLTRQSATVQTCVIGANKRPHGATLHRVTSLIS